LQTWGHVEVGVALSGWRLGVAELLRWMTVVCRLLLLLLLKGLYWHLVEVLH